jgi:hypothetical protein
MIPSTQQVDRLGRNVVFYVDGLGEEALPPEERTAWSNRTGLRASDCGLTDESASFRTSSDSWSVVGPDAVDRPFHIHLN